jgi:hypothetical protein
MNRKIFGIFICLLFFVNLIGTINAIALNQKEKIKETTQDQGIIVVGVMDRIEFTEEYKEYIVHLAIVLEESIDIFIDEEKILRLYNPHGLEYGSLIVVFCDNWEFI